MLMIASLLVGTVAMAMTSKTKKTKLVKGTSIGQYAKQGAPIDITYVSEHVDIGDISAVHIVLSSRVTSDVMHVKVNVDKGLNEITTVSKELSMPLKAGKGKYPIDLKVSADEDGLYYIKLLTSIKGKGFRAFAVPVYVGSGVLKMNKKPLQKMKNGENITVSPAQESIIKN